jgi:hypothetical protein
MMFFRFRVSHCVSAFELFVPHGQAMAMSGVCATQKVGDGGWYFGGNYCPLDKKTPISYSPVQKLFCL